MLEISLPHRRGTLLPLLLLLALGGCGGSEDTATPPPATTGGATPAEPAEPVSSPPAANATAPSVTDVSVDSETLPYAEIDDELIYGYFAFPTDMVEPLPAVVLIHDIWGLTEEMRTLADQLAAQGYMVLAVDLFRGQTSADVVEARQNTVHVVENPVGTADNLQQALVFVGIAGAPRKAALGFGLGGTWALNMAEQFPEDIDAAVIYYGNVTADEDRLQTIDGPVLGLFGAQDRGVSMSSITDFEATMRRLGKAPTVQIYSGVGHAFADPARQSFDADTTADAWRRTIDFLAMSIPADDS